MINEISLKPHSDDESDSSLVATSGRRRIMCKAVLSLDFFPATRTKFATSLTVQSGRCSSTKASNSVLNERPPVFANNASAAGRKCDPLLIGVSELGCCLRGPVSSTLPCCKPPTFCSIPSVALLCSSETDHSRRGGTFTKRCL